MDDLDPGGRAGPGEGAGGPVDPRGDGGQAVGAVVHRVERGDDGQEHLGGADVAGGLLPADVLLAGLEGQAEGGGAVGVDRHPDQAAGQGALEALAHGHEAGVGAAEAHGHAEALGRADHHVGADLAGRAQQAQRQQVGGHGDQRAPARGPRPPGRRRRGPGRWWRGTGPARRRASPVGQAVGQVGHDHGQAERLGPGADHRDGLGVAVGVDHEGGPVGGLGGPAGEGHGLGRGGGLVEQRGVGQGHAGEVGDHGLEVEQGLQATLGDLRLVRRVGGVPGRVLEDVAPDHRRGEGAVVAQPDHRGADLVAPRPGPGARPGPRSRPPASGRSRGAAWRMEAGTASSTSSSSEP